VDKVLVTPPWPPMVTYVAKHMRPADVAECLATYGPCIDPGNMLQVSVRNSTRAWGVRTPGGTPLAIFGVAPYALLGGAGVAWMIGTPAVDDLKRQLLVVGREYVDRMLTMFDELTNFVSVEHTASLNWLRHLGFTIEPAAPYGAGRQMFHQVTRKATRCATLTS